MKCELRDCPNEARWEYTFHYKTHIMKLNVCQKCFMMFQAEDGQRYREYEERPKIMVKRR